MTADNSEYIRHLLQPNKLYKIKKAKYIKTNYNYCFSQEYFLTLGNEKGELLILNIFIVERLMCSMKRYIVNFSKELGYNRERFKK